MGTQGQILLTDASIPEVMGAWGLACEEGKLRDQANSPPLIDVELCEGLDRPFVVVHVPHDVSGDANLLSQVESLLEQHYTWASGVTLAQLFLSRALGKGGHEAHILAVSDMSCMSMSALSEGGRLVSFDSIVQGEDGWVRRRWRVDEEPRDGPAGDVDYSEAVHQGVEQFVSRWGGDPTQFDFDCLLDLVASMD